MKIVHVCPHHVVGVFDLLLPGCLGDPLTHTETQQQGGPVEVPFGSSMGWYPQCFSSATAGLQRMMAAQTRK